MLQVNDQQTPKPPASHVRSHKHLPCQILKSGKACTLGAKCPFAHGEHERGLGLAALLQHDTPMRALTDGSLLKHAVPSPDSGDTASRQHSASSSLHGTLVGLMSSRLGPAVLIHVPYHDATCCMMAGVNVVWLAHLGQGLCKVVVQLPDRMVMDSQSEALDGCRVNQWKGGSWPRLSCQMLLCLLWDLSKVPWRISMEEQLMTVVCWTA